MTDEHYLVELDAALNRLACDRIVGGSGESNGLGGVLDQWAESLLTSSNESARALGQALRAIADSPADDDQKLADARALVEGTSSRPSAVHPSPAADSSGDAEVAALRADPELTDMFVAEALDHLGTIEATLLALDERPNDTGLLNDIFRPFHTVKGNAGALGITSVQEVAHHVESLLDLARSGQLRMGPEEVDVVLRAVDVLTLMISDLARRMKGHPAADTSGAAATLVAQVEALMKGGEAAAPATPGDTILEATPVETSAGQPSSSGSPSMAQGGRTTAQASIKVDTGKLDSLVDSVGELIVVQSLIRQDPVLAKMLLDGPLARNLNQLQRITADLQRNAMALRMVPIRQSFQKISRLVRDLSRKAGKSVELVLIGDDTELDRKMVEEITDPLMHMVRNSIDHGIETQEVRAKARKPARATVVLSASHQGGHILIEVSDDGRGLETERILARARERGLVAPDVTPSADDIYRLIFEPGFSTAEKVTEISGRGVGMDVVRRNIESLRGRVDIQTERGKGTRFLIRLPLTLAVLDGLLVSVGPQRFVLPTAAVRESLRPTPAQVHYVQGEPRMVQVRQSLLPLLALGELFDIPSAVRDASSATVVVIEDGGMRVGLIVDGLLNKQEVVVKSLGEVFAQVKGVAGGAILGDGRIGLILDPHGIIELMRGDQRRAA